jgi:hypothetical protein
MNTVSIDEELITMAEEITGSNYEASGSLISTDAIEFMLEELIHAYNAVVKKFEEYVKEVDENYRRINTDPYLEYGVNEREFV